MAWLLQYQNNDYEVTTGSTYDTVPLVTSQKGRYDPDTVPVLVKIIIQIFEAIHAFHRGKHITVNLSTPQEITGVPQYEEYSTGSEQEENPEERTNYQQVPVDPGENAE